MITRFATLCSRLSVAFILFFTVIACGGGGGGSSFYDPDSNNPVPSLTIATTALAAAITGVEYSELLEASGGEGSYSWVILDDDNTGLTINDAGILNGIVLESGTYGLTIQVEDNAGTRDRASYLLTVNGGNTPGPLQIATTQLPDTTPGADYTAVLEATGGQSDDYQWTLNNDGGSGLQLRPDGVLNGTAPVNGQYALTVSVQDGVSTVTETLILDVGGNPLTITTSSLPEAEVGRRYVAVLQASGGVESNYIWDIVDDDGTGFTLSQYGVLSGTPTTAGDYGIVVQVFDGTTDVQSSFILMVSPAAIQIVSGNPLPNATVGVQYTTTISSSGGGPTSTWEVINTVPAIANGPTFAPPGNASTGVLGWAADSIVAGQYKVTIKVTNLETTDQKTFDLDAIDL